MDLMNMLDQSGGITAIANELGISPQVAAAGASVLLPAIAGGFQKQAGGANSASGLGSLVNILGSLGGGALATQVLAPEPTPVDKGNEILGQIFGSKEVSRTVAAQASQASGIDPALLRKMLPMLAMLVGGYLATRGGAQDGGFGSILGSILGGGGSPAGDLHQPGGFDDGGAMRG
ncbi:MAG: DUF937 domain-containing protein [Sphingomonadales bacterium]|nr:DUF937 domain-containing protein [Sphingomonadales bacterium]MDE2569066.1 DUF937 domain-containing protein [Sphingomonadales bacterium]